MVSVETTASLHMQLQNQWQMGVGSCACVVWKMALVDFTNHAMCISLSRAWRVRASQAALQRARTNAATLSHTA